MSDKPEKQSRSGARLIASVPEGANTRFFRGRVVFVHHDHKARSIPIEEVDAAKPSTLEEWLALGEEIMPTVPMPEGYTARRKALKKENR